MTGKVKFYKPDKKFGFITGEDGKDYFVHQKGCIGTIRQNDRVTFTVGEIKQRANLEAFNVEVNYNE